MLNNRTEKWEKILLKAIAYLESAQIPVNKWSFGGGTALMSYYHHRYSKDIDIFLTDVQYLTCLSPRLNDHVESDKDYAGAEEQSNYLKIKLKGDVFIDFIAAPYLTKEPIGKMKVGRYQINIETPPEIIVKKIFYRAEQFKSRDIFDLAVVIDEDREKLIANLDVFKGKLPILLERCQLIKDVYQPELKQLITYRDQRFIDDSFGRVIDFIMKNGKTEELIN
ncbi:MAG: nucleotidyl transferase AbiEii/AbiGii toxin family protein [bacterium]